jgi:tetraacyldisaccharide 4'-kinase
LTAQIINEADKFEAILLAMASSDEVDIIITDDGLQHYALARDIELVVVDGARRFGNACLLPMGPLREPVTRLKRVDAIICNGGEPGKGEYPMQLVADTPRRVRDDAPLAAPLSGPVDALAGIGHPPRFFATLEGLDYQLDQQAAYGDHHPFDRDELVGRFGTAALREQQPRRSLRIPAHQAVQSPDRHGLRLPRSSLCPQRRRAGR